MKLKSLIFDLDDTLLYSDPVRIRALKLSGHPKPSSLPLEEIRYKSPLALMKAHGGIDMKKYWNSYIIAVEDCAQLTNKKLPFMLLQLQSSGTKLGLVTSSPEHIAIHVLRVTKLYSYFDACIIGYGSCKKNKARGIRIALKRLCVCPEEAAYIGDSRKDYLASTEAGVYFILASWGCQVLDPELKQHAYRIVYNVEDLLTI